MSPAFALLLLVCLRVAPCAASAAAPPSAPSSLYVDCSGGSDTSDGSAARPFLTLTRARDALAAGLSDPLTLNFGANG
jgi:hypothetical protein